MKLRFAFVENQNVKSLGSSGGSSVFHMMRWFGLPRCFILSPVQPLASPSQRRVLYSALVCAIDALQCPVPAFLVSTPTDALHRAREVLGYSIAAGDEASSRTGRGGEGLFNAYYESALMEGIERKNSLYYLDGLISLFNSKIFDFSNGYTSLLSGKGLVRAAESYFCRVSDNDRFLTRSVAYNHDAKKLRLHPEVQSTIEDLTAAFPDREDTSASLNKLVIKAAYGARKYGRGYGQEYRVDDNEFYTTFHPSALPYHQWEVEAEFLPLRNGSDLEPQGLAFCLRQLLAMYVAGQCCPTAQNVLNMSGKNGPFPVVDRNKALIIASVLSIRSRDAVSTVCSPVPPDYFDESGNLSAGSVSIPQDLLMRVFSRSLWVDIQDTNSATFDPVMIQGNSSTLLDGQRDSDGGQVEVVNIYLSIIYSITRQKIHILRGIGYPHYRPLLLAVG
jgi:hypothetical protein